MPKILNIILCSTGCGGLITAPGLIKSPVNYEDTYNYFSGYSNNANCTWVIRAPENQVVQLVYVI